MNEFNQSTKDKGVTGKLLDPSIAVEEKVIMFFMDIWNEKWFPYEMDDILKY